MEYRQLPHGGKEESAVTTVTDAVRSIRFAGKFESGGFSPQGPKADAVYMMILK